MKWAVSKKKKTKAASEDKALNLETYRMRGRGGTPMATGIKSSALRDLEMHV
jgi:hypothetical protein